MWARTSAVAASLVACGRDVPAPPPPAGPIVARTRAAELAPADGRPMRPMSIADYRKEFAGATSIVVVRTFPDGLTPAATAGINLSVGGTNVSYVLDGNRLVYDANANGDLRDDPWLAFDARGDLTLTAPASPTRLRLRGGELYGQQAQIRRGTLALPNGPMAFALVGDRDQFGLDYQFVGFDLDRDGKLDLETLDNPELFHGFEKAITLDDRSYAIAVPPNGESLTLTPLDHRLPPRAPLVSGTPAPDVELAAFDGSHSKLSALRGRVVLVDFWASFCHPCVKALPALAELRARLSPRGFELVAIAEPSDDVHDVLAGHEAGIEALDGGAAAVYRVDRFPTYFVVGRDGVLRAARCTLDQAIAAVEAAL